MYEEGEATVDRIVVSLPDVSLLDVSLRPQRRL
jgi:hypothetical protein